MDDIFIWRLAQPGPDPGGGAAAAYGGLIGLAVLEKIIRLELNRRDRDGFWTQVLTEHTKIIRLMESLKTLDVKAYSDLMKVKSFAPSNQELDAAFRNAAECPQQIMDVAQSGLEQARTIGDNCKSHLTSDLLVGVELLGGCLRGSYFIARQNVRNINDEIMKEGLSLLLLKKLDEGISTLRDLRHRFIEI